MSGKPLICLLVIGRAPRVELEGEFRRVLGKGCEIRTIGALDHVPDGEISAHRPKSDADTLFSIPPGGRSTLLSKAFVTHELQLRLTELRALGGHVNVLCCTGHFPQLGDRQIVTASNVLLNFVRATADHATTLGVFIPKPQQIAHATDRWRKNGFEASVIPLAPDASNVDIDKAAERMNKLTPGLVVYDCISYRHAARLRVETVCKAPAIVASSAAAHVVAELLGV
jgi:hypothetical protein